jgi:hypothetical protein
MQTKLTILLLMVIAVLFILFPVTSFGQYVVGDTVADFSIYDVDSNLVSLYDFYGDVVLLNFYATW